MLDETTKIDKTETSSNHEDGEVRRRSRRMEIANSIGPRDVDLLRRFMTEHGKIIPARLTGVTAKQQRRIARFIRRLRVVGLLP